MSSFCRIELSYIMNIRVILLPRLTAIRKLFLYISYFRKYQLKRTSRVQFLSIQFVALAKIIIEINTIYLTIGVLLSQQIVCKRNQTLADTEFNMPMFEQILISALI